MKAGISLTELAQKIEANRAAKADYVADTSELTVEVGKKAEPRMQINGHDNVALNTDAVRQIGDRVGIPAKYIDRMAEEAPQLLAQNVNHWFREKPERRMVRTLNGTARAFLSDRYQRIDHEEVAEMVLPILSEIPDLRIESCQLTEQRMYVKAVTPRVAGEVTRGDVVQAGVVISNSEIGKGAVLVQKLRLRLVCTNGMIMNDGSLRAHHVGGRASSEESVFAMLTDETLRADDRAILLKVRDVCRAVLSQDVLDVDLQRFREAGKQKLTGNPTKAVEVLGKRIGLTDHEQGSVLRRLIEGGDISRWGLANAVTRFAQDPVSYDRATELEALGHRVLDLAPSDWRAVAEAA